MGSKFFKPEKSRGKKNKEHIDQEKKTMPIHSSFHHTTSQLTQNVIKLEQSKKRGSLGICEVEYCDADVPINKRICVSHRQAYRQCNVHRCKRCDSVVDDVEAGHPFPAYCYCCNDYVCLKCFAPFSDGCCHWNRGYGREYGRECSKK